MDEIEKQKLFDAALLRLRSLRAYSEMRAKRFQRIWEQFSRSYADELDTIRGFQAELVTLIDMFSGTRSAD